METFSEREGLHPIPVMQLDSIDAQLKNRLWNVLSVYYFTNISFEDSRGRDFIESIWIDYLNIPIDDMPYHWRDTRESIKKYIFNCKWNYVYDLLEYVANSHHYAHNQRVFINQCNIALEKHNSAWRFVNKTITCITSREEIAEIEMACSKPFPPIKEHMNKSLAHLSDRESPDYRNSIKESISAVESLCQRLTGKDKATLGDAVKLLDAKIDIHPCLKTAFDKLYGYTSNADGIRHALLDKDKIEFEDAKFMLVVCSAFINYAISKASKVGLI